MATQNKYNIDSAFHYSFIFGSGFLSETALQGQTHISYKPSLIATFILSLSLILHCRRGCEFSSIIVCRGRGTNRLKGLLNKAERAFSNPAVLRIVFKKCKKKNLRIWNYLKLQFHCIMHTATYLNMKAQ